MRLRVRDFKVISISDCKSVSITAYLCAIARAIGEFVNGEVLIELGFVFVAHSAALFIGREVLAAARIQTDTAIN